MATWRKLAFLLAASLLLPALSVACSGDETPETEDDTPFVFPKKDVKTEPDLLDLIEQDDAELTELPAVLPDAEVVESDLEDVPGLDLDVIDPEDLPLPDEVAPPDVPQDDTEEPIDYPFQSFGPLTVSMKGPMLNGQYLQLRMAEISYWKHPAERWEELLDLVQEAGFNGIYTSACWAMHEPAQGQFDFATGNRNLNGFLQLVQARGLHVYFAAGPWLDGEAGGCLPAWLASGAKANASPIADGQLTLRVADADYQSAAAAWFDQVNAVAASYQVTSFPQGPILFYQVESSYDLFTFLKDADGRVQQEMLGIQPLPVNVGLYMAQLRDTVQADGINAPIITSITGDFENGGRMVIGTGDTPGLFPATDLLTESEYDSMELKLWNIRKEMRKASLHGQVYMAVPGIAVGVLPSPAHMARLLMAGADVVVVRDFAASVLPLDHQAVGLDRRGIKLFAGLDEARVTFGNSRRDPASPIALSGLPRASYWDFRQLNRVMSLFASGFVGKDLPYRSGPNKVSGPYNIELSDPAVGAIEDKYTVPVAAPAAGILELMSDHFKDWYQAPEAVEPTGRATYFFDSSTGAMLIHLVNLDDLEDGANAHHRDDLITKLTVNGAKIPRHSNIVVPATDRSSGGEPSLGWGSKFVVLNYPLGIGYPLLEYSSTNLAALKQSNNRMLLVAHGQPLVKSDGVYFTEPGEISLANIGGIPDIILNALPGGGIHTDPGGKLAIQFQHDETGYLVLGLPGGKQLVVVATSTPLARNLQFVTKANGYEMAVMGFDRIDGITENEDGMTIEGAVAPPAGEFLILTDTKPYKVEANGGSADCDWEPLLGALHCTMPALPLPDESLPLANFYTRQESYSGSLSQLGFDQYPDQFAQVTPSPVKLEDAQVGARAGIAWYSAEVELGAVPPNLEGFLSVGGAADIVSVFVNGTYVGSSSPLGNIPMAATDVAIGLPTAGFRLPAGILVTGLNSVAIRVISLGRSGLSMPLLYASAPLLPPELDALASLIPHLAVEGLNVNHYKGLWGPVKVTVGAMSAPINGPWTISKGDGDGLARTWGMLQGWHEMNANPGTPGSNGFGGASAPSKETPVLVEDGQMTWVTATFSSDSLSSYEGGLELALEGKSLLAFVFLNGHFVGTWFSDMEAMSQGLYSKLVQGAGTRQLLANLDAPHFGTATPNRVALPSHWVNDGGGTDNRVTCLLVDLSPALAADLVLPTIGSIAGQGYLSDLSLHWNRDGWTPTQDEASGMLLRSPLSVLLQAPPQAPQQ